MKKNFDQPDETKTPEKKKIETINIDGFKLHRTEVAPGWQWSKNDKPIVGGESCMVHHIIYMMSGNLHVKMNDGTEKDFGPGDIADIPPGHDGWNAGDKSMVWLEIQH